MVIRVNVDNIHMGSMHTAGFLVEGCTNNSIGGRGGHLILFWEVAVILIFQGFLNDCPFFSDN
jgi:hypothetical protein